MTEITFNVSTRLLRIGGHPVKLEESLERVSLGRSKESGDSQMLFKYFPPVFIRDEDNSSAVIDGERIREVIDIQGLDYVVSPGYEEGCGDKGYTLLALTGNFIGHIYSR